MNQSARDRPTRRERCGIIEESVQSGLEQTWGSLPAASGIIRLVGTTILGINNSEHTESRAARSPIRQG